MNRLKKAAVKIAVSCVGLWFVWQVISILPPIKNIQLPGNSGLSINQVLATFFLTLIALAIWVQSREITAELEAVFSKLPVLRLLWEDARLFVFLFFLYRGYIDFLPRALGTGASLFSWCFFLILAFPIARIAWHGYHNLDMISDANTWTQLQNSVRQCAKCGGLNQAEAAYCRLCGTALTHAPAKITRCVCGADVRACDSFCAKCGRPPVAGDPAVPPPPKTFNPTCPNCSAAVSPENQFCAKCGAKI